MGSTESKMTLLCWSEKEIYSFATLEEFDNAAKKLWPMFQDDMPPTFLYPKATFHVVHKRIRGLKSPVRSNPGRYLEHLWIKSKE